jgi:site-specific DNA-methyltransferase (adenine-specific)
MTPYYDDGVCTIHHGDCAEIAPTLGRFDLLCTDPPYGIGEARKDHGGRGRITSDRRAERSGIKVRLNYGRKYEVSNWDDAPPDAALLDSLRDAAEWQCIFGGNYFTLPPSKCWLVWDKENGASDFADAELAWTNYTCAVRLKRYRWNGFIRGGLSGKAAAEAEPRYHPTQKPLAVMSWAIGLCPERPTSVLDPFMGSGTTLRACKDLGIRCVGIEREERYCEIAARRLGQGVLALGVP